MMKDIQMKTLNFDYQDYQHVFNVAEYRLLSFVEKFPEFQSFQKQLDGAVVTLKITRHKSLNALGSFLVWFSQYGVFKTYLDVSELDVLIDSQAFLNPFAHFKMYGDLKMTVHFKAPEYSSLDLDLWRTATQNVFSGPKHVSIDIANSCTHNCNFCTLYNPETLAEFKSKKNPDEIKYYKKQIEGKECSAFLTSLPDEVETIIFAGVGDPFTHPDMMDFVRQVAHKKIYQIIYSNFSYLTENQLDEIAAITDNNISFVINLSAGSGEVYSKVRTNQTRETFNKVVRNIQMARERNIDISLLFIICKENYQDVLSFIDLALELKVNSISIRPMEVHSKATAKHILNEIEEREFAKFAKMALALIQLNKVHIKDPSFLESICKKHSSMLKEFSPVVMQKINDGNKLSDYYLEKPCWIGFDYVSVSVEGFLIPCCISGYSLGNVFKSDWSTVWHSGPMENFRAHMKTIHQKKFHHSDPEWFFCQQCPHTRINSLKNDQIEFLNK